MKRYENYSLQDFLSDDDFIRWAKNPGGQPTTFWHDLEAQYPHLREPMRQAKTLVAGLAAYTPDVAPADIIRTKERIFGELNSTTRSQNRRLFVFIPQIAASLLLLLLAGWWLAVKFQWPYKGEAGSVAVLQPEWLEVQNQKQTDQSVALGDGSRVVLKPGSRLRYPEDLQSNFHKLVKREVWLTGEAFFDVKKDADRPFLVYASGLVTKVLGTSFTVVAYKEAASVKVQVASGSVSVYSEDSGMDRSQTPEMVLTPNQEVTFRKSDLQFRRALVEKPRALLTAEQVSAYQYLDAPVAEVFKGLEEVYGIGIVFDRARFRHCRVTMVFSDESLYEKLDLISKVLDTSYRLDGVNIAFQPADCHEL